MTHRVSKMKANKNKNKGFSLVEIVLAIAVLAIVVTPVFNSFITSYTVNRNSRKLMAANDAAQTVMEGIQDKTYEDVRRGLDEGGINDGSVSFCSISENYYNTGTNLVTVSSCTTYYPVESSPSDLEYYQSTASITVSTPSIVSSNDVFSGFDMCKYFEMHCKRLTSTAPGLRYQFSNDKNVCIMQYDSIVNGGYTFDVVVALYPTASVSSDKYYPYGLSLLVYDHIVDPDLIEAGDPEADPVLSMSSGIRTK